jgi:ferredoxin
MTKISADFYSEIKKYGNDDFKACYNCGNCTAVCNLTDRDNAFPRKLIRYSILGLEEEITTSLDPWLCYYCGDCITTCPRNANPGELMMTLRRYLSASYDWTGLARKFYTSKTFELSAIALLSLFILLLFVFFHGPMTTELTPDGGVKLNTFAPWKTIEAGDWLMAAFLSFFLLSNVFNMFSKVILSRKDLKIPLAIFFTELKHLIFHFISQWRFSDCETDKVSFITKLKTGNYNYWLVHFFLMTSYVTLFTMIVGFLGWFQTDEIHPWWHPQRLLGYYATFGLLFGTVYFFVLRIKKQNEKSKNSHYTDWTFLVLLFLTTFTGILVHVFRIYGFPMATYYIYVLHLMILFPMLMIEVPFSKWSHLAYRPFAIYFSNVIKAAEKPAKKK